jgi:hypothetical protein
MTSVAALEAEMIHKINELIAKIEKKSNDLIAACNKAISKVPGFIGDKIRDGAELFISRMKQVWEDLTYIFGNMGSPNALSRCSDEWSAAVGGPMSGLAGFTDPAVIRADDSWTGAGFRAYKDILPQQGNALKALKTVIVDGISTAMSEVSKAIMIFWGAIVVGLGAFVGCLIGAIASTATILGAPAGPVIAAGGALVLIGAVFAGGYNLKGTCLDQNSKLIQKLNDNGALSSTGTWPTSTANFTDGTTRDGTPSGWNVSPDAPSA